MSEDLDTSFSYDSFIDPPQERLPTMLRFLALSLKNLWEKQEGCDYVIKVQGQEFHVHRAVLVAVSDFFKTMLTTDFKESHENVVELKALEAAAVEEILKYIYTGTNMEIDMMNIRDLLGAALHLQIKPAIQKCRRFLSHHNEVEDYFELLQIAQLYSLQDEEENIHQKIYDNVEKVLERDLYLMYSFDDICEDVLKGWKEPAPYFDLFHYMIKWIQYDKSRMKYIEQIMSYVKFPLMTLPKLQTLILMSIFGKKKDNLWKRFVQEAIDYKHLPMWQRVQKEGRDFSTHVSRSIIVFTTSKSVSYPGSEYYQVGRLGEKASKHKLKKGWNTAFGASAVTINNFLIVVGGTYNNNVTNGCFIFDPRVMTWERMGNMNQKRIKFPLVAHGKRIIALGGVIRDPESDGIRPLITSECEVYDFESTTNKWSSLTKLPIALSHHAACVIEDSLYVSGGLTGVGDSPRAEQESSGVYHLDICTGVWTSKAPMFRHRYNHSLYPGNYDKKKGIIAIGGNETIQYYDIASDQWTDLVPNFSSVLTQDLHSAIDHQVFFCKPYSTIWMICPKNEMLNYSVDPCSFDGNVVFRRLECNWSKKEQVSIQFGSYITMFSDDNEYT